MVDSIPYKVFLIGAGGIGMSAIGRYYNSLGKVVSGYDLTPSLLTKKLIEEGISITYIDDVMTIPVEFRDNSTAGSVLVIYTPAIPPENRILNYFKAAGYKVVKRSEHLGELVNSKRCIAVAGTHGKTSVSTMIAHLLNTSAVGCTAFLGGISKNYNKNIIVSNSSDFIVTEADEFDRSFLRLNPEIAVITSIDPDHLDIYGTFAELKEAFRLFAQNVKNGGKLLFKRGLENMLPDQHKRDISLYKYGFDSDCDFFANNIRVSENGKIYFDFHYTGGVISNIELGVPGHFNIENSIVAIGAALLTGVKEKEILESVKSYKGVERRFEMRINLPNLVLIDDYAHHPEEIKASVGAVRRMYPGRKITGAFQPHLFSRTRDFADEFAESLGLLDALILLDIYPARENPIEGISSKMILDKVNLENKYLSSRDRLPSLLAEREDIDIILIMGAGNISEAVDEIEKLLLNKYGNC